MAALIIGGGVAWYVTSLQQSAAETAQSAPEAPRDETIGGGGSATDTGGSTADDACDGMLGDQPVSGDYVVLWEGSDILFQESYTLAQACQIASDRFGGDVRIMDSTDYWDLNIDLNRYGIWTAYSGPYDKATAQQICSGRGSCNVRLIQPCSRSDGQACGG